MGAKAKRTKFKDKNGNKLTYRQAIKKSINGTIDSVLPSISHKSGAKMRKDSPYDELHKTIISRRVS